ncbi:ABC transporter substrate-binding protein [Subtercola sp. YIM 133946]|uniref:ABC transporter substrate-binding protein n=1 Tax=Subtercola sp. YIM 133946 TaxID=3118909 RepID=UPI002F9576CF
MHKKITVATLALLTVASLALAGCSSAGASTSNAAATSTDGAQCGPLTTMTSATVATNPGNQDLVIKTVKSQGLDTKYNLNLDVKSFLNPPASAQAITQGAVDFGFGGLTTMDQARAGGSDVVFIGALSVPTAGVFVPKGSSIKSLSDLKGKRVGSFTALNGATTAVLQALAKKAYGVDLLTDLDGQVHVAPDAELYGLMDQGQLDAIVLDAAGTAYQVNAGNYTELVDLTADYNAKLGYSPLYLGPVTTDSYAQQNCSAVRAYNSALRDAVQYILSNSSVWTDYAASLGQPEAAASFQKLYTSSFVTTWTQTEIDAMKKLIKDLLPYLDPSFPQDIPDSLFTLNYPPLPSQ